MQSLRCAESIKRSSASQLQLQNECEFVRVRDSEAARRGSDDEQIKRKLVSDKREILIQFQFKKHLILREKREQFRFNSLGVGVKVITNLQNVG